jgi:hypothetical protein
VTYVYAVEALTNDVNWNGQLLGPPSATTAAVTPTAAAAAVTQPLSINASSAPPTGTIASGQSFTVDFNQAVTLASTWSLIVTDGAGNEAELDNGTGASPTLGDATATVVTGPDGVNSAITYTLTSAPTMIYGIAASLNLAGMEILSQSGVSTTGGAWNIIGSGPAVGNDSVTDVSGLSRRFNTTTGDQNFGLPRSPNAISENAPNSVVVACNVAGSKVTVYDATGASIGSESACTGAHDTINTATFVSGASLYVTETPAAAGSYESLATFIGPVVTFSPSPTDAIAPAGTLGDNQGVTVTATVTTLGSPDPGFSLGLSFTSTAAYPGTANVAGTALLPTSQSFTTNASGQLAIHYTSSGDSTTQVTGEDMITSATTVVPVNGPDVYSYAPSVQIAFTSGPGVPTSGSPTAVEQPTWTGTATSPPLTTITHVMCDINLTTATAGTINTGGGTDSVTWSWTAPSLVGDGLSSVSCTATDSSSVTGTVGTSFVETGNPLLITSVATGLLAPWSAVSGPADGGNTVTITGTGFGYATGVFFGGFAATSFIVVSNTEITAVAPGGTAGLADVTVTNEIPSASNAEPYTYVGPLATAVVFANHGVSGSMDPGDTITITYDEAMDPTQMGAALNVAGNTLTAGGGTTTPVSLNAILGATGTLGSFAVAATGTDTVNAALSANGETLTLTLVAVNGAALSGAFTPAVAVTDLFANAEPATAVVPTGSF